MTNKINTILKTIAIDYKNYICSDSRYYVDVNIAKKASDLGFSEVKDHYKNVFAIVPIKNPVKGMRVRVDGRTFINYVQFDSGVVAPSQVARAASLPYKAYIAKDSMIYNYA